MTPPPSHPPEVSVSTRSFWQRRVRDPIRAQLVQGITPKKVALTLAVGGACALFPIFGTTTLLCIAAGIALKLNQPIIHLLNQLLWPAHIPVMYLCIRLGEYLFRAPRLTFDLHALSVLFREQPRQFFEQFGLTALHAIAGWCVLAPPFVALVYALAYPLTNRFVRKRHG